MRVEDSLAAWPVVHARTQFLDYRPLLLARPPWLTDEDFEWIKRHISPDRKSGATGSTEFGARAFPETLRDPGGERWVYMRKDGLVVFGVLGMATTLSVVDPAMTHEMKWVRDRLERGRVLDAFVGFAFRPQAGEARGFVPVRDLYPYQLAYEHCLRPRWGETLNHSGWLQPTPSQECAVPGEWRSFDSECDDLADGRHATIRVFPRAEDSHLWRTVATGRRPASLVIGMPGVRYASSGAFDIATTSDALKPETFDRIRAVPPKADPPVEPYSSEGVRNAGDGGRRPEHRDANDRSSYGLGLPSRYPAREPQQRLPPDDHFPPAGNRSSGLKGVLEDFRASCKDWLSRSICEKGAPSTPHRSDRGSSNSAQEWPSKVAGKTQWKGKGKDS